jgi:lipooligosaccharide transport system permease protein
MSTLTMTWQGASKRVNLAKILRYGAFLVAESRLRNMSKWRGSIIGVSIGNPVIYLAAIGIGVGSLVDANAGGNGIDGVRYLVFLAPALLATAAIQATMDETMFPTMAGFKWQKNFFAIHATPLQPRQIADGVLLGALARTGFTVITYSLILLMFGALGDSRAWLMIPAAIFAGAAWGSLMMAITTFIIDDDGYFAIIGRFVVAPMFLFSGTFYPLSQMPIFLQWIGWISPLWHATEIGRFLSYGHSVEPWLMVVHFVYLVIMLVGGLTFARRRFEKLLTI